MTRAETLREARRADRIQRRRRDLADQVETLIGVQVAIERTVAGLRRDGVSWATIAAELGVTKQAAQQRFDKKS